MNLFKRFKKSSVNDDESKLFSFSFYVDKDTHNIILDFKSQPKQAALIAEFCFKLRNDEDLWTKFYDEMNKNLDKTDFSTFKETLMLLYTNYAKYINDLILKTSEESDDPVISPLQV